MYTDRPTLRDVEAFPVRVSGKEMVCLRDPQKLAPQPLVVSPDVFFVVSLFDGAHTILDIQEAYMRRYGDLLFSDRVREMVEQLDSSLLLQSGRASRRLREVEDEFRASGVRGAFHAGEAYEADPEKLRLQCGRFFAPPKGPGEPSLGSGTQELKGVVAPHIDMARGGPCFAWAYGHVVASPAELYVIFGTAHTETKHRFALTLKHFDTPLGQVETDRDFVREVLKGCDTPFITDELVHRAEHSIEFQVVFLQCLLGGRTDFQIVPILCGGFQDLVDEGTAPRDDSQLAELVESLKQTIRAWSKRTCLIAGADLAHVGRRFGHPEGISDGLLKMVEQQDKEMLALASEVDAEGFYRSVAADRNRRNICGLPPIWALLSTVGAAHGELLRYQQAVDEHTQSVVSFASMAFY